MPPNLELGIQALGFLSPSVKSFFATENEHRQKTASLGSTRPTPALRQKISFRRCGAALRTRMVNSRIRRSRQRRALDTEPMEVKEFQTFLRSSRHSECIARILRI